MRQHDLAFLWPLLASAWAAVTGLRVARNRPQRRAVWRSWAAACSLACGSSLLALIAPPSGSGGALGLYVGMAASACVLIGSGALARGALREKGWAAMIDPVLIAVMVASLVVYLLVVPGLREGDALLTVVLVGDVVALVLAAAAASGPVPVAVKAWLLGMVTTICLGNGAAAAAAAGVDFLPGGSTAVLWGAAAVCCGWAARRDRQTQPVPDPLVDPPAWAAYGQTLLPLAAIVGYPLIVGVLAAAHDGAWRAPVAFFAPLFLATTAIAFARQAVLLIESRRAAVRERRLTAEALRRNRELEALTGLATTLTEVLDEQAIMAQGLEALRVAARTSSSALHLVAGDDLVLAAQAGDWDAEGRLGPLPERVPTRPVLERFAGRHVARLPLGSRGRALGLLTLTRLEDEGPFPEELGLLGLLADQLAVALQNARDYHERLEAAIRDPLTGLYNRRYFFEIFGQEVARHERYGTGAALAIFDIDDFRAINDELGAGRGDEVLQEVARIVSGLTRPTDIFSRTGGEEFALLMPETNQLEALLVAERLRTAVARHRILGDHPLTMSGGVAALPQDGTTREDLQRHADLALSWAKRNGKNLCAVASEALETDTQAIQVDMLAHLHGVVAGIDAVQLHTRDHSENVASYAVAIAGALRLPDDQIVRIRRAAFLHDIGKVAVPDTILGKPSGLTDEEFEAIKVHPGVGETMLHHAGLHEEARWVGAHHERLDGRGYPHGLRGDQIPLEARIIFAADSFEAMTSDRPYSRGMPVPDAVAELRRCRGSQFDPAVVDALVGLIEQDRMVVLALRDPV